MTVGVDFGSSVTDAVLEHGGKIERSVSLLRPGPATGELLRRMLEGLGLEGLGAEASADAVVGVTGGRSRELPERLAGLRVVQVSEPEAIGRGGSALSGATNALVVSCGTGTAMVTADVAAGRFRHVTGTPVGGGTLEGLGQRLLGVGRASEVAELAALGDASAVDSTLADVLGAGVGDLPPSATAASLAKLRSVEQAPADADLAAGLVTMVAQTIALIAINAARATDVEDVVFVGRLATFPTVRSMLRAVFAVYGYKPEPRFPEEAERATALGAALATA